MLTLPVLNEVSSRQERSPELSRPEVPQGNRLAHRFDVTGLGPHLLMVEGTRIYGLSEGHAATIDDRIGRADESGLHDAFVRWGLERPMTESGARDLPPIRKLSLAIAQACNLGCSYCYAQGGDFGGEPVQMSREVARSAVTRLVTGARRGDQVHLGFIGGEPLLNRPVLHDAVELAIRLGAELGVAVEFGITTNGTLLTKSDIEYLEEHHFTVTISLDGVGEAHDRLRKTRHGHGTYERIIDRIGPWLAERRRTYVLARVTVTPINMQLAGTLDQLMELGFDGVAFAPLLHAPSGHFELDGAGLSQMLADLIACGERFEKAVGEGRRYPFLNMERTLRDLHQGSSRSLPCGAVASYLGASAEGGLFACHRFVNDEAGWMGDVNSGIDDSRRMGWLRERNVDRQEPCRSCWARYLCGGGCHHELLHRGRVACDFIRGWWHYALQAYVRLLDRRPDFFAPAGNDTTARVQGRSVLLDTHSGR